MEEYVTRIGDVTIQRVIPGGAGPPVEPVRVMESEELLRAVKQEPLDDEEEDEDDEGEEEEEEEEEESHRIEGREGDGDEEQPRIKEEPRDMDEDDEEADETESRQSDTKEAKDEEENDDEEDNESGKRKADDDEDSESKAKKKKMEIDLENDKKKISNLRRNIREVMDEAQLDEATLAAQRQEAERLRRVQDQQKYLREVQRQIQLNKQNSKTQSRVISLLQGGSTSLLKTSAISSSNSNNNNSNAPSTVLVKLGSGQQQALNRKTLEVLRGGKTITTAEPARPGITRVTPGNRPAMVTPSVSIAPVKPIVPEGQKKDPCDTDVVTISSSSDSEDDCILISEGEAEEEEEEEDVDTTNSGMHTNDLYNIPDEQGRVLINVGKPESEPEIYLAPQIARIIKPHQIGGVRFLFDNVVESIERFNTSTGFGCILAHSMGLGKTLQVVSFCDVFLRETLAKTVMCIMPINTLQNWVAEFNIWLPTDPSTSTLAVHGEVRPRNFGIYVLNDMHKTISARAKVVEEWNRDGGVLLIGYEMYRQLSLKRPGRLRKGKKRPPEEDVEDEKNKPLLEAMHEALVRPGPDLVICDEGHRIKNSHASISHALKQIRTKRRVVLTGYPLQNNLLEYWCMVDFVRPNYLGTKTEFSNMFERPIQNGQCIDSTPQDIRLMRYRAHVLHSLLEGFVQRRSHSVLRNTLPQKEEYVILVRMTSFQRKLYDTFMNEVVRTKAVPNPLKAFAVCCKIWNHPDILYNFIKKKELDELQDLDIEETANLHTGPNSPRRPLAAKDKKGKTVKKAQVAAVKPEVAAPPQPQASTPEVKSEERKFDFPPSQSTPARPPEYGDYYPPPYPELSYPYHRPPAPGMYYPGYYQDNPGYYPGYESGYPGYFGNFGPYSGSKNEDYDKQSQSWGNNYGNNKEKNQSKSPKNFESSKPGYQEFYPVKEEKPEVKEEKQQFLSGFSGGQVSYNYRSYSGYSEYPYPPQDYPPGWNKGTFPNFSQGEPPGSGNGERNATVASAASSVSIVDQKNNFNSSNQPESGQKLNISEDRSQCQSILSQNASHVVHQRNQSNQNINETHSLHSSSDQQRLLSSQEHIGGNQTLHSVHESMQTNHLSVAGKLSDDQQRRSNQDHGNDNQQGIFFNQRSEGSSETISRNHDNLMRNRNSLETEPNRLHTSNHAHSGQQGLLNTHDQLQRTHKNMFGNKNAHENEYRVSFNQEHLAGGQPIFSNLQSNKDYLASNQNVSGRHNIPENSRVQGSQDQNLVHQQNNFSNQRHEHVMHREHMTGVPNIHESQVRMSNPQEQISRTQTMFGSQEVQKSSRNILNVHDVQHRGTSSQDHLSATPQNMYGSQRSDHSMQTNKEHASSTHQNIFGSLRNEHGVQVHNQEHLSNNHKNMFRNQRVEHSSQVNHDNMPSTPQSMYLNPRNEHNLQINQENLQNNQQNIYGTQRGDHNLQCNSDHMSASQLNVCMNQRNENNGIVNPDHLVNTSQNLYPSQQRSEQNNSEHLNSLQQNIYSTSRDHTLQRSSEKISITQQDMFGNQRSELNIQDNPENNPGSQQNMFCNVRDDHGVQVNQDHMPFSHQNLIGNQTDQQRAHMEQENLSMGSQQRLFSGRNDLGPQTNQDRLQQSPSGNQEKDIQHRVVNNQDRLPNNMQVYGNTRNELIPGCSDRTHRHQEGFVGNKNIHEMDSKLSSQGLKPNISQNMFASQRIDHSGTEQNIQQSITGIQERVNPDHFSGYNRYGNQDSMQGIQHSMYRGQNVHESQNKSHMQIPQQNIYGNQLIDRGIMGGQELQNSSQTIGLQSHHQTAKRSSSGNDNLSLAQQQESYGSQGNDHSMQKIMKTDNQVENQQMARSVQECSPNQFNMFPNSDGQYRHCNNQETIQGCRTSVGDNQNSQESSHRMPISIERHLGNQSHNIQDQKHANQSLFSNQNIHGSQRWLHNNQELPGTQQNLFDNHGTRPRDDSFQVNQNLHGNKDISENQQKFHNTQECISLSQQNMFLGQNNQISIQRQEHMLGKQQNIQENQYRRTGSQDIHLQEHQQSTIERQQGLHNSQDPVQGSPQNVMCQKNPADHQNTQGMASNPGIYGNQLQRNMQGNQEYMHNNQCSSGNSQNVPGSNPANVHISHQQGGSNMNQPHGLTSHHGSSIQKQELQKGNQNISTCQNYGLQNPSSQMLSGHGTHQSNQTSVLTGQQGVPSNQNMSRPQQGIMNSHEGQQGTINDNVSGSHHSIYGNPFHVSNSQQNMQCIPNPPHHMQSSQQNMNNSGTNAPMFSNQTAIQGNSQIIGGGRQELHGNQSHVQSSQKNSMAGPSAASPLIDKDLPQGIQQGHNNNMSNFSGNQYMPASSQLNVPVSSHSMCSDHLQNSKVIINSNLNIPVTQHNIQSQHSSSSIPVIPISKNDQQKIKGSPQNASSHQNKIKPNQSLSVNQQGTQTGPDTPQMMGAQHRVQNMLSQTGITTDQPQNSFDQTIIMSNKGMSGGQVMQGTQQQKMGIQNTQGNPDDQSRFKEQFDEQFMNDQFQGNYSKSGYFGQDFQHPYQNQFSYQESQFNEQPGPSGQKFRKEDDKCEEGTSKETDKTHRDGEEGTKTMSSSSTSTEKEEDKNKKDKKDDDDKNEKKEGTSKASKEDPGIPYDWATEFLKGYVPGEINASAKMAVFFCILEESIALGDRILVFSQSLFTLNLMEELLQQQFVPGKEEEKWVRNINYYRLDGSTTAMEREKLINEFNSNSNLHLFLVSTRAGSLGINLVGANRVIVFDASWNPCHDTQAVCRVYRYGQKKPCFVYRLVTDNCLEKKIYDRQINKQGMSDRVVDECNPDAHLSIKEVTSLCWDDKTDDDNPKDFSSLQDSYIDVVLQKVIQKHSNFLSKEPFQHESLLVDRKEKKLSQAEKRLAKRSYELEKQATTRPVYNGVQPNQGRPKPMASVRPMQAEMGQTRQRGWIPASVWQRQGMSAQEMTLPLDVVIPTNAADRASIVLKAGQKVMVLKSPKGIYMQLENGKIIAIRTAFKVGAKKPGEQQGKGGEMGRRGGRQQVISPRGRPVRAVGPVSRPPPVTVTVTRKRPTEEEPVVRGEEDSSTVPPPTVTVTPMDVSGANKDAPNPFTAAAAASLSTMQHAQPSVSQQTHQTTLQTQQPISQVQNSQTSKSQESDLQSQQQTAQHPLQQQHPAPQPQQSAVQPQHHQQSVAQPQHQQQTTSQSQHSQQSLMQAQHPLPTTQYLQQPPAQQSQHPQQHLPQQSLQRSRLSQQLPQTQTQQLPIVQPQQPHQPIPHTQINQHQNPHLSPQQQPIPKHQLPPQPIPPHSQLLPPQTSHSLQSIPHSPISKQSVPRPQLSQQPIIHPPLAQLSHQHSQQTHLQHPPQLPLNSMSHPQMQAHPIPPLSKMHQSMPLHSPVTPQSMVPHAQISPPAMGHMVLPHQSLPQSQLTQQPMLHSQVQHPQHYEPPPIPPLVGDQLT